MNAGLIDPFQSTDMPEIIEEYLDHGAAKCLAFNRRGSLLAAGCGDGSIAIWDFDTRGTTRVWEGVHRDAITSVSWTKDSYHLVSSSMDATVVQWDVLKGTPKSSMPMPAAVIAARVHPYQAHLCIVSLANNQPPQLVNFETKVGQNLPVNTHEWKGSSAGENPPPESGSGVGNRSSRNTNSMVAAVVTFSRRGDLIYVGSSKGVITVVETSTLKVLEVLKVAGGSSIKGLTSSRNGAHLLVNSGDRIIRTFDCQTPEGSSGTSSTGLLKQTRDFQNAVNRLQWRVATFSRDSEYVIGASANKAEHSIHIWNRVLGTLEKILEGPPEGILDLAWHPCRPTIASVSVTGKIYLWAKSYTENWSAFAPDFKELEENEEYVEREDEFDFQPDEAQHKVVNPDDNEDEEVDIDTVERYGPYSDSDISEDGLHFLPTIPERGEEMQSGGDEASALEPRAEADDGETKDDSDGRMKRGSDSFELLEGGKRRRLPKARGA